MTKNELINDMSFRQKCGKYGLDWNNFKIYYVDDDEYVILLYTQRNDNYVLFDKNYNTICTKRTDWCKTEIGTFRFVVHEYSKYSTNTYTYLNGENMGYPFEDYTLKNFVDISNRIEIMEINHGHSIDIKINGEWYNDKQNNDYLQLVSYIKFIGEEMKLYHIYNHHMNMMGLIVPDIYQYIRTLITKINECIDIYIKNNKRPYPRDILSYIGQNYRELNFDGILYNVIELLMKEKGVKVKSGYPDELESIDRNEINSLSDVAKKALDILNVSDEELKAKEEEKLLRLMGMAPKTKKLKQNNQEE